MQFFRWCERPHLIILGPKCLLSIFFLKLYYFLCFRVKCRLVGWQEVREQLVFIRRTEKKIFFSGYILQSMVACPLGSLEAGLQRSIKLQKLCQCFTTPSFKLTNISVWISLSLYKSVPGQGKVSLIYSGWFVFNFFKSLSGKRYMIALQFIF